MHNGKNCITTDKSSPHRTQITWLDLGDRTTLQKIFVGVELSFDAIRVRDERARARGAHEISEVSITFSRQKLRLWFKLLQVKQVVLRDLNSSSKFNAYMVYLCLLFYVSNVNYTPELQARKKKQLKQTKLTKIFGIPAIIN